MALSPRFFSSDKQSAIFREVEPFFIFFYVLAGIVSVWHCAADYRKSLNQVAQSAWGPWGRECCILSDCTEKQ